MGSSIRTATSTLCPSLTTMTQPEIEIRRAWRHAVGPAHEGYLDALLLRYGEPHRHYHTATHIMMVIRHLHDMAANAEHQPSPELVTAALYHDAIYDPRSADNETNSASLAARDLAEIGWPGEQCEAVSAMVIATAGHLTADDRVTDTSILLDADLAILGSEPHSYDAYVNGVRAEYDFVDDPDWRMGRGRILQGFLDRPRIFATRYMQERLEQRARANIEAELATLR
jgi:predicted metal-dependent HD superfamily phosphohydrolase